MLNAKQARFVAEYLIDLNGAEAAKRCGYSPRTAASQASRLLTDVNILTAVKAGQEAQIQKADLSAVRVLEELRRLAFVDIRQFFDDRGNLRPVKDWTPEQGSALAGLEVIIKNAAAGDGVTDTVHKFKLWDKTRALEMLCKRFGLLVERLDVNGGLEITWKD
jgi:phage terminase small subunit